MRVIVQRVTHAQVKVDDNVCGRIATGLLVLLGIEDSDGAEDISWLSHKIVHLRVFADSDGVMNRSLIDIDGEVLLVSQFTLYASTKKGHRTSYVRASRPETAQPLYEQMIRQLEKDLGRPIATGIFGADMKVELLNDGPVTIAIDSKAKE